ncbi:hypothetical protein N9S57_01715 [Luminiphilus sp.]|nr:hypothetical protein [Luminiphilus sp.]MDA9625469.1 hypothetical protein [Luminiphilus sp.]
MGKKKKKPTDWESLIQTGEGYEPSPSFDPESIPPNPKPLKTPKSDYLRDFLQEDSDKEPIDPEAEEKMKNPRETSPRESKNETK